MNMMKNIKSSFFVSSNFEADTDLDYEPGDCFDLDYEWKPIPIVFKKKLCDKTRIINYILFSTTLILFVYILYTTINEVYK